MVVLHFLVRLPNGFGALSHCIGRKPCYNKNNGFCRIRKDGLPMATQLELKYGCNPNQKPAAFEDFIALRDKINEICDHTY